MYSKKEDLMALAPSADNTSFFFIDDAATIQVQQLRSMFDNTKKKFAVIQDGDKFDVLTRFDLRGDDTAPVRTLLNTHPARRNSSLQSLNDAQAIAEKQPRKRLVVLDDNNQVFLVVDQAHPSER
jgi:hypothetical protein